MTTMTCPPAEQLKAFYLGQLPDDRSDELVAHVGNCSACQAELETVVDAEDSLIANLRETDSGSNLDREPACELGMLRALGALAIANEPTVDESTSLPKTIGEYEIVRALGQGGMGHVYLARHSKLGRLVALKILAGHRLGDRRASQRFEAEMRAIGRLSHPNIVTAHDAREIDGTAVLVTEYIDGFDLGQLLQRTGPLAVADACEIIRQVALALQYTSDQGFVHRDVKPSNIMLSASGEVKLLDLGLARLQFGDVESADATGTGQTMGTADYISPEQVTDSRKVDVRSDIYSLGATLFKLLVGRAPFAEEKYNTAFAKMTAHVSTAPATVRSLRNDVPDELSRFVAMMLAKRPEDRPQKPDAIAAKLSVFTDGSNLELLARKATLVDVTQTSSHSVTTPIEPETLTQSFWHRPVKLYLAIASGLVGILLGFCFGIIITISNPDGSKTVMQLPSGSKVEVTEGSSEPLGSVSKSTASAPTFNGHTLDEWLTLFQTEISQNGQIAAIAGMKGLLTEQNSKQVLQAVLVAIDSRRPPTREEFDLVRLILGPTAHGNWLIEQLNKNQAGLTRAILINHTDQTWKSPALHPEHYLIANWLADPKHQLAEEVLSDVTQTPMQDCVKNFLIGMFYSPELKGDAFTSCLRAARNQPAIGDADTFLLGVPGSRGPDAVSRFPEDERIQSFADLAVSKLLAETSDAEQVTRSMAILIAYPHLIPDEKVPAFIEVTQKRFAKLCENREHIERLVGVARTSFNFVPTRTPQLRMVCYPSESQCSEALSLLYFAHFLGSPPELESAIVKLREIVKPDSDQVISVWQELTEQSRNSLQGFLVWPFYKETIARHSVSAKISSGVWRAAYYDQLASLIQQHFSRRKKAADELKGSEAANFLGKAMRDFARIDRYGLGSDIQMRDLNRTLVAGDLIDPVFGSMSTNFKSIDADGDHKISLTEYAKYLGERAKQRADTAVPRSQSPVPQQLSEEDQILRDFGGEPKAQTKTNDFQRQFSDAIFAFALSLTEDRNAPITEANLERLAAELAPLTGKNGIRTTVEAIRKSWPFKSVSSVLPGVPPDANWLLSDQERGYTILFKREAILDEIRTFVDAVTGQKGVFNEIWSGLKNDPFGPRFDGDEIIKHLGNQLILCAGKETHPLNLIAVSLTNTEAVQGALRNIKDGPETFRVIKNYLVMGSKEHVDRLIAQVIESPELKAANNLKQIGIATGPRQLAIRPLVFEEKLREKYVQGLIDLLKTIDEYIKAPRKTSFDDHDVTRLTERFTFVSTNPLVRFPIPSNRIEDAVRAACPLNGIVEIREGVDNDSGWLFSANKRAFRVTIKPDVFYSDIKNSIDASFPGNNQQNAFEQLVAVIEKGKNFPAVNLKKDLVDHLRGHVFLILSSQGDVMVALESDDPAAMLLAARRLAGDEQTIQIVGEYLVIGSKQQVEEAAVNFAARPPNPTSELVRIGFAMRDFTRTHKRLPAAISSYLPNKPKKLPPYSWRVAILPFIGRESLYREYDFNEPWDSKKNLKLLDKMPRFYRSQRATADQKSGDTNFLAFVGETTAMANEAGVYLNDVRDGGSKTVLLVETKRSVPWTKPEDLPFKGFQDAKLARPFDGLDLNCLMVDGTVLSLNQPIDWERLGNLITKDGGEPVTKAK